MVYAKILCFDCKGSFELYAADMTADKAPPICPHCGAKLPEMPFRKLHDITQQLEEVEKDCRSLHDTIGATLFSISMENYHPRKNVRL